MEKLKLCPFCDGFGGISQNSYNKYIYKNPKECQRALELIKESMLYQGKDETVNALQTAINYLGVMIIADAQEGKTYMKE